MSSHAAEAKWSFYDPNSTSSHTVSSAAKPSTYSISISSGPKTDWWTTAPESQPESSAHRASGPVVYQTLRLAPDQDWKLSGKVTQQGNERFQQTTLFVKRVNPNEEANGQGQVWLKSGIENEGGKKYVGYVVAWFFLSLSHFQFDPASELTSEWSLYAASSPPTHSPTGMSLRSLRTPRLRFTLRSKKSDQTCTFTTRTPLRTESRNVSCCERRKVSQSR